MSTWNGYWPDVFSFQLHRLQFQHSGSAWFLSRTDTDSFEGFLVFPYSLHVDASGRESPLHHNRVNRKLPWSRLFSDSTIQLQSADREC